MFENQFHALTDLKVSSQKQFSYTSEVFCPLFPTVFYKEDFSVLQAWEDQSSSRGINSKYGKVNSKTLTAEHRGFLHNGQITGAQTKDTQRKDKTSRGFSLRTDWSVSRVTRIRRWSGRAVSWLRELQPPAGRFSVGARQICITPPAELKLECCWQQLQS